MDKYRLKCETVRDLLPIYADKLTCKVTTKDIEKHLADCKEGKIITNSVSLGFAYCGRDYDSRNIDSDELVLKCSDGNIVITVADIKAKGELLTEPQ